MNTANYVFVETERGFESSPYQYTFCARGVLLTVSLHFNKSKHICGKTPVSLTLLV
jgi:hypothetical protein